MSRHGGARSDEPLFPTALDQGFVCRCWNVNVEATNGCKRFLALLGCRGQQLKYLVLQPPPMTTSDPTAPYTKGTAAPSPRISLPAEYTLSPVTGS